MQSAFEIPVGHRHGKTHSGLDGILRFSVSEAGTSVKKRCRSAGTFVGKS
jgi:hypothetical protein